MKSLRHFSEIAFSERGFETHSTLGRALIAGARLRPPLLVGLNVNPVCPMNRNIRFRLFVGWMVLALAINQPLTAAESGTTITGFVSNAAPVICSKAPGSNCHHLV